MKKLFLLSFISLLGITAFSQNTIAEKTAKKVVDKWVEVCSLDRKTQVALFIVILEKQETIHKTKEEYGAETPEYKEARKELNKQFSVKIREVVGKESALRMSDYRKSLKNNTISTI